MSEEPRSHVVRGWVAGLIALSALLLSGMAGAYCGASRVGSHVLIETSCRLLAHAQREGMLDARQRRDVIEAASRSAALSAGAREAVARVQAGCRGVRT